MNWMLSSNLFASSSPLSSMMVESIIKLAFATVPGSRDTAASRRVDIDNNWLISRKIFIPAP